jgi:cytoskeletal protein CcmA (bactofilin family)
MVIEISPPTLIAEGTRVQGSLTFFSNTQVFGVVEGDLLQQSLEALQVGKGGWVNGSITSQGPVVIEGRVDGSISSTTKIRLLPTATVRGSLDAPQIEILAGAIFEGELHMPTPTRKTQPVSDAA